MDVAEGVVNGRGGGQGSVEWSGEDVVRGTSRVGRSLKMSRSPDLVSLYNHHKGFSI